MFFLLLILGLILVIYVYLTWNFDYWSRRGVPAAKANVLLGNFPNALLGKKHFSHDLELLYKQFKGKTPFVGIIQVRSPRLLIFEPELIKDVLIRKFKNFHDNEFGDTINKKSDPFLAKNPFMLQGEEWKEKRAEITPAFTSSRMKALYPLIEDVQARMVEYVKLHIKSEEPFDVRELCAKYATDVVSNAIFGVDAQSFTKENPEIREMGRRLLGQRAVFIFKMFLVSALPVLKPFFNMKFTTTEIETFFVDLIEQALKYREDNKIQREDFLDYLMQLKKKKGIESMDMTSHSITFFTDGFDTSAIAMAHALFELGRNKEVQDKLREEINSRCDDDGKISFETLNDISYLEQVWNETLRMHAPISFTGRKCTEEVELNFDDHKALIEKDINVYIPIHQIHYDPEFYSEPEKFMPERFDPESGGVKAYKDKGVFLPFGDGPRVCLGVRFAQYQSLAAIVAIVKNFEISVNGKTAADLVMDPKEFVNVKIGGLWLDFKPIDS